jgi:predicted AAA+ superfamily ATPase
MAEEPVILLEGPRSVGKSTTLRQLAKERGAPVTDFDNNALRDDAGRDPSFYVRGEGPVFLDEYQRVPAILDAIKERMNLSSRPGQFVITGSTRHDALPGSVQALSGRLHRMQIYPFAQSELEGKPSSFLTHLMQDPDTAIMAAREKPCSETRESYARRIIRGGFPLAVFRNGASRNRWFDDYVRQIVERDIPGIAKIRNKGALRLVLRRLANQTAQILVLEKLSSLASLNVSTLRDYIGLLEDVFMLYTLPAWGRTLKARVAAKPKLHILDSGIASRLMGFSEEKLLQKDEAALADFGHLMESFAVTEILKELSWLDDSFMTGHWRTLDGAEVDFVIEKMDGSVYGFEIKTAARSAASDFAGLEELRKYTGKHFKCGLMLYSGAETFRFGERLYGLPLAKIWDF